MRHLRYPFLLGTWETDTVLSPMGDKGSTYWVVAGDSICYQDVSLLGEEVADDPALAPEG